MDKGRKGDKEVLDMVKETQETNKSILKRLNQLLTNPLNNCSCSRLQEHSQREIKALQSNITELKSELAKKDDALQNHADRIKALEESLMALQTDDSKLRSASVRTGTEKHRESEHECSDENERQGEQLTLRYAEEISESDPTKRTKGGDQDNSNISLLNKVPRKKEASSNIKKVAVERLSSQAESCQTDKSNSTVIGKPPDQSMTVATSQPRSTAEEKSMKKNSRELSVEIVRGTDRRSFGIEEFWQRLARLELDDGREELRNLEGVHSVICLDISESMAEGNAWIEATTFLEDYLKGLIEISDRYGISNEYVALVTFGHVSRVQMRLTNKYNDIRELIGKQKLGGPSPLYAGLVFAYAAAASSEYNFHRVNKIQMFPKVIILTDGHTTDIGQYAGPDTPEGNMDETKSKILQFMEEYKMGQIDTFCAPVGNADTEFLELITTVAGGRMISYTAGNRMARRQYIATKLLDPLGLRTFGRATIDGNISRFSEEDKQTFDELIRDANKQFLTDIGRNIRNKYKELPDRNLPPIGCRVRRGPDWKWDTQDSLGPGTVIGHDYGDQVWVEWDADSHAHLYRYGIPGYDVLIVEEPRTLKPGQRMAVGCVVKHTKGHQRQNGVVIRLNESRELATVRWNNGERGEYSYGGNESMEIEVCTSVQPFTLQGNVLGSGESKVPVKTTKNKNKNINFL